MASRAPSRIWVAACALALWSTPAHAEDVTGVVEEGREDDQDAERFADAATWLPRQLLFAIVRAQAIVARFAHDQQLVPRYEQLLSGHRDARIYVFPTLFAETRSPFSVGVRALAESGPWATQARVGFGGLGDWAVEGGVQYAVGFGKMPLVVTLEGLADDASDLEYYGIGHEPRDDPRSRFASTPFDYGRYREKRRRAILSIGLRPTEQLQLLYSSSFLHRRVEDAEDAEGQTLSEVFLEVPSWGPSSWIAYYELAVRHDSRPVLGPEVPGVVSEIYGGYGHRVRGEPISFARVGGRLATFLPILRPTNILSPRIVVDQVVPVGALPFTELSRQPVYRGADIHRDEASVVVSLDYVWRLASFMSTRLFVDAASVGPTVADAVTEVPRVAGGIGLDLFTSSVKLARVRVGGSADGFHAQVSLGEPDAWGDRQRRD